MEIRFWGVRGSIATPMTGVALSARLRTAIRLAVKAGIDDESKISEFVGTLPWYVRKTAGGNTPCVEITAGENLLVLDAGTGFRQLGLDLIKRSDGNPIVAHILISHSHWDHISGIPFFIPGFNKKNKLIFYVSDPAMVDNIRRQQSPEYFPAPLAPAFEFVDIESDSEFSIGDATVQMIRLNHPGGSIAYRISRNGKTVVYATDSEYKDLTTDALKPFTDFFQDADLLIFDAQYTMIENIEKEDWGHSNVFTGIDLALEANVRNLVFTHHDPTYDDRKLWEIYQKAGAYLELYQPPEKCLNIYLAYEGLKMIL